MLKEDIEYLTEQLSDDSARKLYKITEPYIFDFAVGTDFEQAVLTHLQSKTYDKKRYCKPDIYDTTTNTLIESKCTRPYYDKDPSKHKDASDLGTGLPINQFNRYLKAVKNGLRVVFIHGMTEGKNKGKIYKTELTDELQSKVHKSDVGNTVYWKYSDLHEVGLYTKDDTSGRITIVTHNKKHVHDN